MKPVSYQQALRSLAYHLVRSQIDNHQREQRDLGIPKKDRKTITSGTATLQIQDYIKSRDFLSDDVMTEVYKEIRRIAL